MHDSRVGALRAHDVAIVGMSCRLPGAASIAAFWANLRDGVESIAILSDAELEVGDPSVLTNPAYVRAAAVAPDIDRFDAALFGYSPHEAALIDPQQRMLLECAWEALEDAGYDPERFGAAIGVFAGTGLNTYLINNVHPVQGHSPDRTFLESPADLQMLLANGAGFAPTRISYKLDLRGPSVNIQTACSTGLVAVHMACQSLLAGDCDMVLAGAANVCVPSRKGYLHQPGMIFSSDGHCRAFDARADGTVFGCGGGMVALKLLSAAVEAGDRIHAVIRGSAINNDGATKIGYAAPSIAGQAEVISLAFAAADVEPGTIGYVETHGTATRLGDSVELAALTRAFNRTDRTVAAAGGRHCAIGSVKTNIGHLAEAAGIAGLIKTALAIEHGMLPPSLHFEAPNPSIDFERTPFHVNAALREWPVQAVPRRAGVSAFGMGGTNAHVIVEEAPRAAAPSNPIDRKRHVFTLSARTDAALRQLIERHSEFLARHPDTCLADLCFTVNTGRRRLGRRLAIVAGSTSELRARLAAKPAAQLDAVVGGPAESNVSPRAIAFLFSGQGSQHARMAQDLYDSEPVFRQTLQQCDRILREGGVLERPLLDILYGSDDHSGLLDRTSCAQPALFAVEYALAQMWIAWGIRPSVVMGHSVGEYVAACIAGVFGLEDGLRLVAERGRLMERTAPGRMVAVWAGEAEVRAAIVAAGVDDDGVAVAAINSTDRVVISGDPEDVQNVCASLVARGIAIRELRVSRAFHSRSMDAMLAEFEALVGRTTLSQPRIALISNVTGDVATDEVIQPAYWARHARAPVRFADGMTTLDRLGVDVLIEIGPDAVLLPLGKRCLPQHEGVWLSTLRRAPQGTSSAAHDDWNHLLTGLGTLYVRGVQIDWFGFDRPYRRRRIHAPTYPFERSRHWIEAPKSRSHGRPVAPAFQFPAPAEIARRLRPGLERLMNAPGMDAYRQGLRQLEDRSIAHVLNAFDAMGWQFRPGQRVSTDAIASALGATNPRWLNRLLAMLEEAGFLRNSDPAPDGQPGESWEVLARLDARACRREPEAVGPDAVQAERQLLERCGPRLADALRGACDPMQVLFSAGAGADVAHFYATSPILHAMNVLAQEVVAFMIARLPPAGPVRVLEIGAGTGATTAHVLPQLPPARTEYVFTDIGASLLAAARTRFADHQFVKYRLLDIERGIGEQGFDAGGYDLVIASNVLHATQDLGATLRNVRELLSAHGMLVLVEGIAPTRWVDLTFGFAEGWWRFTDSERRRCSPLVGPESWRTLLEACGFEAVETVSTLEERPEATALAQALLIARANGVTQPVAECAYPARAPAPASTSPRATTEARPLERSTRPGGERREILRDYVLKQVGRVLGIETIDGGRELADMGMDSLSAIELRLCLQRDLGCTLPSTLTYDHPSADALVNYLAGLAGSEGITGAAGVADAGSAGAGSGEGWCSTLVSLQSRGSGAPFFCVPGILGDSAQFHQLARCLGRDRPFHGLRSLGRDEDLPAHEEIAAIAAHHVEAIRSRYPRGPYLLGGHSFGGLVAFEMARQMLGQGDEIGGLVILDIQAMVGENFQHVLAEGFDEQSAASAAIDAALRQQGRPVSSGEIRRLQRVVGANMRAMARYRPQRGHPLPRITLIHAGDRHPDDVFLPDAATTVRDPAWGWRELSGAPVRLHTVPGNHLSMLAAPHVEVLAGQLRACLARADHGGTAAGSMRIPVTAEADRTERLP
jgi:acyl transferase domain-containing protein/thioesterase domain-containing protein/SAM-dependent methyltransferase